MNSKSQNYFSTMTDLYNNGNFDLFKYQLDEEQKILILYILRKFPQEIKDQICEAIVTHHLTKRRIFCSLENNIIKIAKPDFLNQFKKENQQKRGEVKP